MFSFERDSLISTFNRSSAFDCNYKCEDNADDTYSRDCGGESAYNMYETQGGTIYIFHKM